jgi:hypothetical protein
MMGSLLVSSTDRLNSIAPVVVVSPKSNAPWRRKINITKQLAAS